jgi:RND superfamily putative drug exporter
MPSAAGIPLLTAIIGVGVGLLGITALASVVTVSSASTALAIMLGLSCGIDYALFIASRHRANLMRGMSVEDAVALAVGTSGSSVVFAALTVIVALCGLTIVGIPFLSVMGLATISFVPILMIAIIFGLSSDYEGFLVSRIKEEFTRTGHATAAVERGTGLSARVVSAAALIMFTVFAACTFGGNVTIKAIGFSLAARVLPDAFVVRLTLVPAVMSLVGSRIWYHLRWFARHVPDLDIEGARLEQDASIQDLTIPA